MTSFVVFTDKIDEYKIIKDALWEKYGKSDCYFMFAGVYFFIYPPIGFHMLNKTEYELFRKNEKVITFEEWQLLETLSN